MRDGLYNNVGAFQGTSLNNLFIAFVIVFVIFCLGDMVLSPAQKAAIVIFSQLYSSFLQFCVI